MVVRPTLDSWPRIDSSLQPGNLKALPVHFKIPSNYEGNDLLGPEGENNCLFRINLRLWQRRQKLDLQNDRRNMLSRYWRRRVLSNEGYVPWACQGNHRWGRPDSVSGLDNAPLSQQRPPECARYEDARMGEQNGWCNQNVRKQGWRVDALVKIIILITSTVSKYFRASSCC